jgi:hypothetical protein
MFVVAVKQTTASEIGELDVETTLFSTCVRELVNRGVLFETCILISHMSDAPENSQ